jgi:N-acetylglucosaminyldiphosphoundecaprenol N-acetyl-beta-D-mannosaminyltransferase
MKRIDILGTPVDVLTMTGSVTMAEAFIASGRPHQLIAINAAKIVLAHQRPEFRDLLWKSDLNFVDGQPVRFAAQLLGHRLPELISGHFLMERLVATAAEPALPNAAGSRVARWLLEAR